MKRASYRAAVAWIAENDSLGDDEPAEQIKGYVSTLLAADLFDVEAERIAEDVVRYRNKMAEDA